MRSLYPVLLELENLAAGMEHPILYLGCKLGNRTYDPNEAGLDDLHRPDLLAKLVLAMPDVVKPEYSKHFSRRMFADIRASESSTKSLSFRISVSMSFISRAQL